MFRFKVSVNTEAETSVQFYLVYEELLGRHSGTYQYTVNITPQLRLASYSVGVSITETSQISHIDVKRLSFRRKEDSKEADVGGESGEVPGAEIMMSPTDPGKVTITYNPDVRRLQTELRHQNHPLQLIVEYEVDRGAAGAGEVQLLEGYFVHFTAPENLTPIPKHVVFVLDTSGSMRHRKMHQTIAAMVTILGEMRAEDHLTIVSFATNVTVWDTEAGNIVQATPANIRAAITYVEQLEAAGETNINGALLQAMDILAAEKERGTLKVSSWLYVWLRKSHQLIVYFAIFRDSLTRKLMSHFCPDLRENWQTSFKQSINLCRNK